MCFLEKGALFVCVDVSKAARALCVGEILMRIRKKNILKKRRKILEKISINMDD